jgi:hypothetical protein
MPFQLCYRVTSDAPLANPDELVWKHLKRHSELGGLQRESEILDAFLATQHEETPLILSKKTPSVTPH